MNTTGQKLFAVSQMASRSSMRLTTAFRFSSLISGTHSAARQAQRQRSTFTGAMPVVLGRSSPQAQVQCGQSSHLLKYNGMQQNITKRFTNHIVEEGVGTYKPGPFEKKILVWVKVYPSLEKVPERITRGQMKKAADKFRVRVSLMMVAATFVCSAIVALVGRKQRNEGYSVTKQTLARRGKDVD